MSLLFRVAFVAGFCLATVGAAGFASPREPQAIPFFAAGLAVVVGVALLQRRGRAQAGAAGSGGVSRAALAAAVEEILARACRLEAEARALDGPVLAARTDEVLILCRALGQRNEDFLRALGLADYTRIWDGFATAERLLARAWSMAADGFPHEARLELPKARAHLERAVAAAHA